LGSAIFYTAYKYGGVDAVSAFAFGAMVGLFANIWANLFAVMDNLATFMGEGGEVMIWVKAVIGSTFAIMLLYTLVQMARGGGESYE